ncbi:hypothetical protein, partial [Vibrio tasmaniensis]|uniref:hypothetical protein n=1 Tax=Vibrio tasmaniensis TaxID=212663 RepID=UPI00197D2133
DSNLINQLAVFRFFRRHISSVFVNAILLIIQCLSARWVGLLQHMPFHVHSKGILVSLCSLSVLALAASYR